MKRFITVLTTIILALTFSLTTYADYDKESLDLFLEDLTADEIVVVERNMFGSVDGLDDYMAVVTTSYSEYGTLLTAFDPSDDGYCGWDLADDEKFISVEIFKLTPDGFDYVPTNEFVADIHQDGNVIYIDYYRSSEYENAEEFDYYMWAYGMTEDEVLAMEDDVDEEVNEDELIDFNCENNNFEFSYINDPNPFRFVVYEMVKEFEF